MVGRVEVAIVAWRRRGMGIGGGNSEEEEVVGAATVIRRWG